MSDLNAREVEREFGSKLSDALVVAYRRAGGIARLARAPNGAMIIRNIAVLEAASLHRAAILAIKNPGHE